MNVSKDGVDLNVCAYCSKELDNFSRTVDHLYPRSRGGKLSNSNKVPACGGCNQLKANMSVTEFYHALDVLIHFDTKEHKKRQALLKRIKYNVKIIIDGRRKDVGS
jgi:5-methylcytosine-specific restriction endonuclease McrA